MTAHGTPLASTPLADDAAGTPNALTPSRYDNLPDVFPSALVQPGPVTVAQGTRFDDPDTFFGVSVAGGIASLRPSLFTNDSVFYSGVVGAGTVGVTQAARFDDADSFYAPSLVLGGNTLQPNLFTNSNTFYAALLTGPGLLQPGLFQNTNVFYTPVVGGGAPLLIQNARFDDPDTFPVHVVTASTIVLQPPFFSDLPDTFFIPIQVALVSGDQPGGGKAKKKVLRYRDPNAELAAILAEKMLLEEKARAAWIYDRKRKMWAAAAALLMDY